ncbi:sister chromatid cohesion 1 protein 1 [Durio zibethinus]|uniref:Sister chromatid cohesion 1 protein 1 n=1 Tax=Durio zibethinus TaxID=66656 RepID=A0A6P5YUJ5_DURZI|nr:sister chromatid cohesion 1 protein 1 [Durio zibethinus]
MFYSRELLARKASLGQIWLLGTKQAKLDRRKANKLDVARLCEEILNPPVPIALRLSSILMGGVVILYEKKVTFLHDDANRLLVPGKHRIISLRKSITLPENEETSMGYTNVGEPEEETSMRFPQNNFKMQLDQVDDYYITNDPMEDNLTHEHHQADDNDITLFNLFQPNTDTHGQFERFEEGDEGTQVNFTLEEHIQIPTASSFSSPARWASKSKLRMRMIAAEETQEQHLEHQLDQQFNRNKEDREQKRQGPLKRKARKAKGIIIDEEQTIIPSHVYHSWLHDTSDIVSRRGRKKRRRTNILWTLKIAKLMEFPSTVLMDDMFVKGNQEIPYPAPLLDLWKKSTQPHRESPSVRTSQPQPPDPSPPERVQSDYPMDYPFEDLHSGVGSPSHATIELQRTTVVHKVTPVGTNQFVTPGNSGMKNLSLHVLCLSSVWRHFEVIRDALRYSGSSVSGDGVPLNNLEVNIGRVRSKNNVPSTSRNSGSLDTVVEVFHEADTDYKLSRSQKKNLAPDQEFLVETQLTRETPANDPPDKMTENIRKHMKTHFETPGAPQVESLNNLAAGLSRKGAAQLFYQICVLASQGFLRVEQEDPFGDILISKGAKM